MRDLYEVIEQVIKISTNEELNERLKKIQFDIGFTAPELMGNRWGQASMALNDCIPDLFENDETIKIASIFMDIKEESLKMIKERMDNERL